MCHNRLKAFLIRKIVVCFVLFFGWLDNNTAVIRYRKNYAKEIIIHIITIFFLNNKNIYRYVIESIIKN